MANIETKGEPEGKGKEIEEIEEESDNENKGFFEVN